MSNIRRAKWKGWGGGGEFSANNLWLMVFKILVMHILNCSRQVTLGSRDGAVVRAFASHQCVRGVRFPDPVSYVGLVCCWFSILLRGFFSEISGFLSSSKINISKFQFDLEFKDHGFVSLRKTVTVYVSPSLNKGVYLLLFVTNVDLVIFIFIGNI